MKNYYDILNITENASPGLIKATYKSALVKYHPDNNKGFPKLADKKLREAQEAYAVLSDPIKKEEYDRKLQEFRTQQSPDQKNIYSQQNPINHKSVDRAQDNHSKQEVAKNNHFISVMILLAVLCIAFGIRRLNNKQASESSKDHNSNETLENSVEGSTTSETTKTVSSIAESVERDYHAESLPENGQEFYENGVSISYKPKGNTNLEDLETADSPYLKEYAKGAASNAESEESEYQEQHKPQKFIIEADQNLNYYVKIYENGEFYSAYFLRKGQDISMVLPNDSVYLVKYAAGGDAWYGTHDLFGEETVYSQIKDIRLDGEKAYQYDYTLTLYKKPNGNIESETISADEFNS